MNIREITCQWGFVQGRQLTITNQENECPQCLNWTNSLEWFTRVLEGVCTKECPCCKHIVTNS